MRTARLGNQLLRRVAALGWLLLAANTRAAAQGAVSGVVFDSLLSGAPLAGARVVLQGVESMSTTDRRGRFSFARVEPGRYQVTFFHPLLDSLSLSAPIYAVEVGRAGLTGLRLATPSYATTARALCGAALDASTSIVLARVRDAETGAPLPDARGSIEWWEMAFGDGFRPERIPKRLAAISDSAGSITFCGVPTDIEVAVVARLGAQTTGDVVLPRRLAAIATQELRISLTDSAARRLDSAAIVDTMPRLRGGSARLRVQVRNQRGAAVSGAVVSVRGQSVSAVTDDAGVALLPGVPAGSQTVDVRAIGRAPEWQVVALTPSQESLVAFRLGDVATSLPEYVVRGIRPDVMLEAYERRRRGGVGHFLNSDDLDKLGRRATALATVPGLHVPMTTKPIGGGMGPVSYIYPMIYVRSAGFLCLPTIYVDGIPRQRFDGFDLHEILQLAKRVEVYSRPLLVPVEFASAAGECGVVVIWTT